MITHVRNCHPAPLKDILAGRKRHEIRFEDRPDEPPFENGDRLILKEWEPETKDYTGLEVGLDITYVSRDGEMLRSMGLNLAPQLVVLSIEWKWAVSGPTRFPGPKHWAPVETIAAKPEDAHEAGRRG